MEFEYINNPELPTINPNFEGNKFANNRFYNQKPRKQPGFKDAIQWKKEGNPQRLEKKNDKFRLKLIHNNDFATKTEDMIVWLGHASFFIRLNGVNFLTDPCLGNIFTLRRMVGIPCNYASLAPLDFIVYSHGHRDHLDFPSLKKVVRHNPETPFLTPLKIGGLIKNKFPNAIIQEAGWYQQFTMVEKVKVSFLPSIHWNRRNINDFNWELWGSYMFEANGKKIYFGGDSAYGEHYKEIKNVLGEPDIAILGVGAYKPKVIMQSSHTSPQEAVQAFNDLGAKTFIPMHYGTYDLSDEPISEPINILKKLEDSGKLNGKLANLAVGEEFVF